MPRSRSRLLIALACGIFASGLSPQSYAIEWGAEPAIGVGYEYNDNIFLTTVAHEAVNGFTLSPSLDLSARQESWELRSSTQLTDRRYVNRSDLDADNGTTGLSYVYQTERNQLRLKGAYTNEAAWASSQIDPDIGLVQTNTRRATKLAEPNWNLMLTENLQLNLDYEWTAVTYENGLATNLLDYQQRVPSLTLSDQITSRTSLTAVLAYSEFEVTTPQDQIVQNSLIPTYTTSSRSTYAQVGITYAFSENLNGSLMGGPRKTVSSEVNIPWNSPPWTQFISPQFFYCAYVQTIDPGASCGLIQQTTTTNGNVFSGQLESTFELTHATLKFSRSVGASGSGSQVQSGNVNLRIDRQITQDRLSAWFEANGYLFTALSASATNQDRHYYQLTPGMHWRWTRYLSLDASYRYQRQRYVGQNDYARSNAFYVTLSYRWPKFSVSR